LYFYGVIYLYNPLSELKKIPFSKPNIVFDPQKVLEDYRLAVLSRQCSLLVRKEVFSGRAKFGIYGDGKELCQIALANSMRLGDYFSGYYRDQTVAAANGDMTWPQYFAQLYGHPDIQFDPHSGGRQMNNHHATRLLDDSGDWLDQTNQFNSIAGVSSTGGQIPKSLGIAYASKLYQENIDLTPYKSGFSKDGKEVCFTTIGDASTSEGMFLEGINAAGVLQIPVVFSVWDDGYGISVPIEYQTTKASISEALAGYQRTNDKKGLEIIQVKAWDYPGLISAYQYVSELAREEYVPCLVHVIECTQPQGHSASGSHERYKSTERLAWEQEIDCNALFKIWILEQGFSNEELLNSIEEEAKIQAKGYQKEAFAAYMASVDSDRIGFLRIAQNLIESTNEPTILQPIIDELKQLPYPIFSDLVRAGRKTLRAFRFYQGPAVKMLRKWLTELENRNRRRFSSHQMSESESSPLKITAQLPTYEKEPLLVDGREILNKSFSNFLEDPRVFILGEDVGKIGDVNQTLAGLQEKFGELQITDTGIREMTIVGQGIGAAMRGLKPIIEIQYLDYIFYPFQLLSDDLACMHYRTAGGQKAPMIVRTRGHRLEGIWHSGSPMGTLINGLRGMHFCVPRNMTQAAGMYRTLLEGDDPGIVIECLNGYRLKEPMPNNLDEIKIALGVPEVLREGNDVTVVTYGSMCRIVMEATEQLAEMGISVEVIDVQTLLPFDRPQSILQSIQKTHRVLFADEDMPGGASAYMMQEVLDKQGAFSWLDSPAECLAAAPHRPAYSSDGDYFSKPNVENVVDKVYEIMRESDPTTYPAIYF
jgi:pyruvate/2-oxoglutarate/acetoin dehydrogenase E1 component/TPP-dependent pyruvate/acetoin dehydrogenase alpha subunit